MLGDKRVATTIPVRDPAQARSFYEGNRRIANTRIKSELGVKLRFPTFREGLAALLEETAPSRSA